MLRVYYWLTKPGIIYGNVINTIGGFMLAAVTVGKLDFWLFMATIAGIGLVIASACVFNNYLDRDIDKLMQRTEWRALARGSIPVNNAMYFACFLGAVGIWLLALYTNLLATGIALVGFVVYVAIYGIAKRYSVHGTVIGSVAGAVPPVVGYTAVTNQLDAGAWIVFLILVLWQMPHFYAIAMYRLKDYKKARLPVLPVADGMEHTKLQILAYIIGFAVANALLTWFNFTGAIYLVVMVAVSAGWLLLGVLGLKVRKPKEWAHTMFYYSLIVILVLDLMLAVGGLLP